MRKRHWSNHAIEQKCPLTKTEEGVANAFLTMKYNPLTLYSNNSLLHQDSALRKSSLVQAFRFVAKWVTCQHCHMGPPSQNEVTNLGLNKMADILHENILKFIFVNENCCIWVVIFLRFVFDGLIDNNSGLVQMVVGTVRWQTIICLNDSKGLQYYVMSLGLSKSTDLIESFSHNFICRLYFLCR